VPPREIPSLLGAVGSNPDVANLDLLEQGQVGIPIAIGLALNDNNMLLAGASWMAEYGNPDDPREWEFIQTFSPYQMVKKDVRYPRVLFTTSTRDDRVHPAHARKMMARLTELGYDVRYYENIEGGHVAAADNAQLAFKWALVFEFLWQQLGGTPTPETT